jgi:hypothetical protein
VNKEINNNKSKLLLMSTSKSITINSKDFSNIENIFFKHLQENPNDTSSLKTIQSIIDQLID